ncbi:MAG: circularly permuted type 2 ATP-grasp protein [Bryobacterales bacterium]
MDVIPCVLSSEDWAQIEAVVTQRAHPQRPAGRHLRAPAHAPRGPASPAFAFSHPGYLRPCYGMYAQDGIWLNMLAIDFARAPDGRWRVIGERTEAPIGSGYALENRLVTNETFGEAFDARRAAVSVLLHRLQAELSRSGQRPREPAYRHPRLARRAPPTYFEHAFLARYLGYTLAEGSDLTVRERKVWLAHARRPHSGRHHHATARGGTVRPARSSPPTPPSAADFCRRAAPGMSLLRTRSAAVSRSRRRCRLSCRAWHRRSSVKTFWSTRPRRGGAATWIRFSPRSATSSIWSSSLLTLHPRSREFVARMGVRRREELADRLRANPSLCRLHPA